MSLEPSCFAVSLELSCLEHLEQGHAVLRTEAGKKNRVAYTCTTITLGTFTQQSNLTHDDYLLQTIFRCRPFSIITAAAVHVS